MPARLVAFLTIAKAVLAFAVLVGSFAATNAAISVDQDWASTVTRGTSSLYGSMVAIDSAGYIYVTGSYPNATIITAKYDQLGRQIWQREFDNPGTREQGSWLAADPSGGVVVAGYTLCCDNSDSSTTGFVTLKYDANGDLLWNDVISLTRGRTVRVELDAQGNAYVIGRAWVGNPSGNTTDDMLTVKYSPEGVRLWTRAVGFDDYSADTPSALAIAPNGDVVVTGGAVGWFVTARYDSAGNLLWSSRLAASGGAADVALGPAGEIYTVGGTYTPQTGNRILVVKQNAAGGVLWSKMYAGNGAKRVAVDWHGGVVVTGYTNIYSDWLTHKLDATGLLLWSRIHDTHRYNDEFPYFLTIGPSDEIYITGQGGPNPTSGELSYLKTVTVRYAPSGTQDWEAYTDASVRGLGVRRGPTGTITVVGHSPFVVFHYVQSGAGEPPYPGGVGGLLVRRDSNGADLNLTWDPACGASNDFGVFEGILGSWYTHEPVVCSTGGVLTATITPAYGSRYFLVAPMNASEEGICGTNSAGQNLPPAVPACRPFVNPGTCP